MRKHLLLLGFATPVLGGMSSVDFNDGSFGPLVRSTPEADPPPRISSIEATGSQVTVTRPGDTGTRLQQTTTAAAFFRLLAP